MTDPFFAGLGTAQEPVTGLRNWRIDKFGRLTGVTFRDAVWTPGENTATCLRNDSADGVLTQIMLQLQLQQQSYFWGKSGQPPVQIETVRRDDGHDMEKCPHGFYAYYDGSRDYHEKGDVTGIIQGYGETLVGTRGFRCAKARILAIKFSGSINESVRSRICAAYPDVAVFRSLNDMLAEYPTSAGDAEFGPHHPDFWTKKA